MEAGGELGALHRQVRQHLEGVHVVGLDRQRLSELGLCLAQLALNLLPTIVDTPER